MGDREYSVRHGEYFFKPGNCSRCLCDDGEATFCEYIGDCDFAMGQRSCDVEGTELAHGDTFEVSTQDCCLLDDNLYDVCFNYVCRWTVTGVVAEMAGSGAHTGIVTMMTMMVVMTTMTMMMMTTTMGPVPVAGHSAGLQSALLMVEPTNHNVMPFSVLGISLLIFFVDLALAM